MTKSVEGYTDGHLNISLIKGTVMADVSKVIHSAFATLAADYSCDDYDDEIEWNFFTKDGGEYLENSIYLTPTHIVVRLYNEDGREEYDYTIDNIREVIDMVDLANDEAMAKLV